MAADATIGGDGKLFVGEDKTFLLELLAAPVAPATVATLPVDMAGWALLFDIRLKDNSAEPAIVSKVPEVIGVFDAVRATNTQRAVAVLTDDEMNLFKEKTYRHSWKRMTAGQETVLAWGDFTPQKATAP